ncbi:UDP-N-acetylmuramoyl-L-alanine--D-glutamate ligase [Bacillus sp. FJAT-45066]|uniref:UDP-N-acetylmuramoyl-L-alanine--D-glutamate ligase n=1 Tax=Bacillus sp. FJAT-45066 TaxID=2011010 RepID=UPI000BB85772|nr:UDP-N-acetylmuramoyl-L-alanine--D-glutamate ligase [Bacillus sp. FJAT-45066]
MKSIKKYENKNILVLGLAKSGTSTAKLLHELKAKVIVNDMKPFEENEYAQQLSELGMKVVCGEHPLSLFDNNIDYVFKNPGIPYSNLIVEEAKKRGIPVLTEVELAYEISEAPFIGITGSNGKTTTTTLIFNMLQNDDKKPLIAGNIGEVAVEVAQRAVKDNVMVTELSSFQLMGINTFKPKVSVLLNIFEAHLDYHGTKEEYVNAKAMLLKNQTTSEYCVYNADDPIVISMIEDSNATKVPFSTKRKVEDGTYIEDSAVWFKGEKIIDINDIVLPGKHNLENILASIAACKLFHVENKAIVNILTTFTGVKHRLQFVDTINGRRFYNDSKATNILSTEAAINAFDQNVILLAGGLDRGNEFHELIPSLGRVKSMVVFGQTAGKLEQTAKEAGINSVIRVDNVEKAVTAAYEMSESGDVILLSPACASWDQYKTFEQRGDIFINAVHMLK